MGFLEGYLISQFDLPIFNVSLAFNALWYGFTLFFIGAVYNFKMPHGLVGFSTHVLVTVKNPHAGTSGLQVSLIYVVVLALCIWFLLKYTVFGQGSL